ncbi:hypothetical protein [Actinotalea sp. K2]|uniref:hypothetical protein n=1 Tax=Actinotalea sp. K2 TaxID=2939438 RepID=UPI0020173372|nr:hypothetical protein [Actinotalea sp. K2]MCL3862269.1 hypothetical protein [Actinotalea sp. K2]
MPERKPSTARGSERSAAAPPPIEVRVSARRPSTPEPTIALEPGQERPTVDAPPATGRTPWDTRAIRHVPTLNLLERDDISVAIPVEHAGKILQDRMRAVTEIYSTLDHVRGDLERYVKVVPENLPASLRGQLVNPNGTDAAHVSVRALEPTGTTTVGTQKIKPLTAWTNPETRTDARGSFRLALPQRPIPDDGLTLRVSGSNRAIELTLRREDLIGGLGKLGTLPLDHHVSALPRSVLAQLGDVLLTADDDVLENPELVASPPEPFSLGEGECARSFRSNLGVIDRYRYSMLVRLVAPHLSARRLVTRIAGREGRFTLSTSSADLSAYLDTGLLLDLLGKDGEWELSERWPVEAPIDVSAFLDDVQRNPRSVPKAATLALGYVVGMRQVWIPAGLSLGDLVYSLPLAPGEQQRIALSDERETLSVRDQESMTAQEQQRYTETADSSTTAVFSSAFDESASGGSRMKTSSDAWAVGGGGGVGGWASAGYAGILGGLGVAGGYASSTTTGSTSSWQSASRDYVSSAAQDFHSNLARQSAARRSASRTSVRLASASERREVVTKVITNHNRNHALTMQYWQVLRHFSVTSQVDDVQLVCFVPLELVQFLPAGQSRTLGTGTHTRASLLARYQVLLAHHDVLATRVRRDARLRHGLTALQTFAGHPLMDVEEATGPAQDTIDVELEGSFLPFEDVYVTVVSVTGARVGPVRLTGASAAVPPGQETPAGLLQALRTRRADTMEMRRASVVLPHHVARTSLARLELSRAWRPFSYRLSLPDSVTLGDSTAWLTNVRRLDVTLTGDELERELGGPTLRDPVARIGAVDVIEAYFGPGGTERMPVVMPIAAKRLPPVLAYADVLRIEALLQHVVENTVEYSKAVWQSLTPEERAIMLEQFTIGVPTGGVSDPSDEVPLLNCVANVVLGYFGNAAVMPFFVPTPLAEDIGFTARDVQDALLRFHRQSFAPAQSSITLPARGVLGEAVLGSCSSSEKIDLTRFWNWQDSPTEPAPDPSTLAQLLSGPNALVGQAGAQAPANLQTNPIISVSQGATAPTTADLAKALVDSMPDSKLPENLTGLADLAGQMKVQTESTAESLNKTISEASGLAKAAMSALPGAIKAKGDAAAATTKAVKDAAAATTGPGGSEAGSGSGTTTDVPATDDGPAPDPEPDPDPDPDEE